MVTESELKVNYLPTTTDISLDNRITGNADKYYYTSWHVTTCININISGSLSLENNYSKTCYLNCVVSNRMEDFEVKIIQHVQSVTHGISLFCYKLQTVLHCSVLIQNFCDISVFTMLPNLS